MNKLILCFKCPEAVDVAVDLYVENARDTFIVNGGKPYEFDEEELRYNLREKIRKWVKWNELLTIEIDLLNDNARICKNVE